MPVLHTFPVVLRIFNVTGMLCAFIITVGRGPFACFVSTFACNSKGQQSAQLLSISFGLDHSRPTLCTVRWSEITWFESLFASFGCHGFSSCLVRCGTPQ